MRKGEMKRGWMLFFLLVSFAVVVSAQELGKKFDISFKNAPLSTVLKQIGKHSGVRVEFAYEDVKDY